METLTVYEIDELSEDVQEKVIERFGEMNLEPEWWDHIFYDVKAIGKILGIDINKIYFEGFYTQGQGSSFIGTYEYEKGSVKKLKEYAPLDETLHEIAAGLQNGARKVFYTYSASIKPVGFNGNMIRINGDSEYDNLKAHEEIEYWLEQFNEWIFQQLRKEYDYLTTEDAIKETLRINEFQFTEDGVMIQ